MITPLGKNIVVGIGKEEGETKSGIVIPGSINEDVPNTAVVVKVGSECRGQVKVKDKVLIRTYGWDAFEEKEERYLVGPEENIIGVYDK